MIVDDDDAVRSVIVDTLQSLDYECHPFASGAVALRALRTVMPDLIILDFAMPGMNGAEVAQEIRAVLPGRKIIFVSGFAESEALDTVLDADCAVLRKPFAAIDIARLARAATVRG